MSDATTRGRHLIAAPGLDDPNFDRSVVFMIEHGVDGALGLVLNHATGLAVDQALPGWAGLAAQPAFVHSGGPVSPESIIGLALAHPFDFGAAFTPVIGHLGLVDLANDDESDRLGIQRIRVYAGYSGWAPGQLEAELDAGGWLVLDVDPADPFTDEPEALWEEVLRREGGRLARLADYPADPSLN